jgi:hypothetical protein
MINTDFQTAMNVYHGFRVITNQESSDTREWRVDFRNGRGSFGNTARTIIRCPWDTSDQIPDDRGRLRTITRIPAGHNIDDPASGIWPRDDAFAGIRRFRRFIQRLHDDGYLGLPSLSVITQNRRPPLDQYGEIMAGNYEFQRPENWDTSACEFAATLSS